MRRNRSFWLVGAVGAALVLAVGVVQGCGLSKEAQARQDDWMGRAERAGKAWREGRSDDSAGLLATLWEEKARSPQPEGGIPPRSFNVGTAVVVKDERAGPPLAAKLREQLAVLERWVVAGEADEHQTEVWYDLAGVLQDTGSLARVVEAGRGNRRILSPLLTPREQRAEIRRVLEGSGHAETANVLELTAGEALAEGLQEVLCLGGRLTPGLLATY